MVFFCPLETFKTPSLHRVGFLQETSHIDCDKLLLYATVTYWGERPRLLLVKVAKYFGTQAKDKRGKLIFQPKKKV